MGEQDSEQSEVVVSGRERVYCSLVYHVAWSIMNDDLGNVPCMFRWLYGSSRFKRLLSSWYAVRDPS